MPLPPTDKKSSTKETLRDIVSHYLALVAGLAGTVGLVSGVNMLIEDPTLWQKPGMALVNAEMSMSSYAPVALLSLSATLTKIGLDFAAIKHGAALLALAVPSADAVASFRRKSAALRKAGWALSSAAAALACSCLVYFAFKSYGLMVRSDPITTAVTLSLGAALPWALLRTSLVCRLLPEGTQKALTHPRTKELPAFDAALHRMHLLVARKNKPQRTQDDSVRSR